MCMGGEGNKEIRTHSRLQMRREYNFLPGNQPSPPLSGRRTLHIATLYRVIFLQFRMRSIYISINIAVAFTFDSFNWDTSISSLSKLKTFHVLLVRCTRHFVLPFACSCSRLPSGRATTEQHSGTTGNGIINQNGQHFLPARSRSFRTSYYQFYSNPWKIL